MSQFVNGSTSFPDPNSNSAQKVLVGYWTREEDKQFELLLLAENISQCPKHTSEFIASKLPNKSAEQVLRHYMAIVKDVEAIESGIIPMPNYLDVDHLAENANINVGQEMVVYVGPDQNENNNVGQEMVVHVGPDHNENNNVGHEMGAIVGPVEIENNGARHQLDGAARRVRQKYPKSKWSEEEHRLFLVGLQDKGKGDWRGISRSFVKTRSPTQVASHAQKYFLRRKELEEYNLQQSEKRRKKRKSIHDITFDHVHVNAQSQEPQLLQHHADSQEPQLLQDFDHVQPQEPTQILEQGDYAQEQQQQQQQLNGNNLQLLTEQHVNYPQVQDQQQQLQHAGVSLSESQCMGYDQWGEWEHPERPWQEEQQEHSQWQWQIWYQQQQTASHEQSQEVQHDHLTTPIFCDQPYQTSELYQNQSVQEGQMMLQNPNGDGQLTSMMWTEVNQGQGVQQEQMMQQIPSMYGQLTTMMFNEVNHVQKGQIIQQNSNVDGQQIPMILTQVNQSQEVQEGGIIIQNPNVDGQQIPVLLTEVNQGQDVQDGGQGIEEFDELFDISNMCTTMWAECHPLEETIVNTEHIDSILSIH